MHLSIFQICVSHIVEISFFSLINFSLLFVELGTPPDEQSERDVEMNFQKILSNILCEKLQLLKS